MSGFPYIEPDAHTQLIIVHMDDSTSEIDLSKNSGAHGWEQTRQGIEVCRDGGFTAFPWITVKSFTCVYPDQTMEQIQHLDPDHHDAAGSDDHPDSPSGE